MPPNSAVFGPSNYTLIMSPAVRKRMYGPRPKRPPKRPMDPEVKKLLRTGGINSLVAVALFVLCVFGNSHSVGEPGTMVMVLFVGAFIFAVLGAVALTFALLTALGNAIAGR